MTDERLRKGRVSKTLMILSLRCQQSSTAIELGLMLTWLCISKKVFPSTALLIVDVFKAILSHSGMLIRDKLTIHRKAKPPPNQIMRQLSSYKSYTHLNDLRTDDRSTPDFSSSETASRRSTESLPTLRPSASALSLARHGSGYMSPLAPLGGRHHDSDEEKSSGIFNNALTRHLREISHLSRHRDGIGDDNEESSVRKTKMLLGKFVGK